MFADCPGSIWRKDRGDFSPCFLSDYLQTLLPLLSCGLSILVILTQWIVQRRKAEVKDTAYWQPEPQFIDNFEDEDLDQDADSISKLTLQRTVSQTHHLTLNINEPKRKVAVVSVELLALFGQVGISIAAVILPVGIPSKNGLKVSVASLLVWFYILSLASFRLLLSTTSWHLPFTRLWNHTAVLYAVQWLLQVWSFRSVLIQSNSHLRRDLTISQFTLTSFLLLIALTSRNGNKAVLLEHEPDIEPSREGISSLLSLAFFSWVDPIIWTGWKKTLELSDVWNLALHDRAEIVLTRFRRVKKTHRLAVRLLINFQNELLIQGAWGALAAIFMFLPSLLLKVILEYLEDQKTTPVAAAWLYVALLFVAGIIQGLGDGQSLWIGRRICAQLRAILVGEIYSKILRKAAASAATELDKPEELVKKSFMERVAAFCHKQKLNLKGESTSHANVRKQAEYHASNGAINTLMAVDSWAVADISAYLHFLWAAVPVQLIIAVTLLYNVLGFSSLAGIGLMVMVLPLNLYIAKSFQTAQKAIMAATDKRMQTTGEVLQNIRIIKYFAWESRFANTLSQQRQVELSALWRKYVLWSFAATVWSGVPIIITFASFAIFTLVEKRPLLPSVAFPALSMFSLLRVPLDQLADMIAHVQQSAVSVDRVEKFLKEVETEKYQQMQMATEDLLQERRIALQNATLTWGSTESGLANTDDFRLIDVDVEFKIGKLNLIAGPTGSGKTSLLMALLGEMKLISGLVFIPGGQIRQQLQPDPVTGLTESVAFCAQQAWLVNASIKENILFSSPFDSKRYQAVILMCALGRDLEIFDNGDETLVGEKGITLSGGQKQRISLARAIYSDSRHLLLDDCLSAVDSHTARHIFEQAIRGDLMLDRTCILVSHNVALTAPDASYIVVMNNGKIAAKGTPAEVIDSGVLEDLPASGLSSTAPSRVNSTLARDREEAMKGLANDGNSRSRSAKKTSDTKLVDTRQEAKATGSIKASTVKMYLLAMGPWYYWVCAVSVFIATQIGSLASNVWIREWANAYRTESSSSSFPNNLAGFSTFASTHVPGLTNHHAPHVASHAEVSVRPFSYNVDVAYYLGIYALIGAAYILICLSRELVLFYGTVHASLRIHERLLRAILHAKLVFFDRTPLGQITNRFSKDIQSVDQEVGGVALGMFHTAASVVAIIVLISIITPGFLIPGFFISLIYIATGLFYVRSSRDLKRIESVQRSPLFQHLGETLSGIVTIRAYGVESRFMQENNLRVNTYGRATIYLGATNRWLQSRMDIAGALVSFFAGLFVVVNARTIDAGAAGLALSYAITFTQNVLWLVRLYAANEQNMNSVERIQEYIDIDQEAAAQVPETAPATGWPSCGAIEFVDYSTRYRSDLDLVLKQLTFTIESGEKVGVVGRTGAGKSSLALALFRGLEADAGKILIDDVDIGVIGLQNLREALTIVPQDPTLFQGTLRSNLDPFQLFTDEKIREALRRVQLVPNTGSVTETPDNISRAPTEVGNSSPSQYSGSEVNETPTDSTLPQPETNSNIFLNLDTAIAEAGSNVSQGQRQLVCLARALLRSSKILVMDEATASVDYLTDTLIQDTLRELKNHTLITIAHRLQTIIDYDKILVLDRGEVIEYDHPWNLIQKEGGSFRSMCEMSGQFEVLLELAKKAWLAKRLVDDS